MKYSAPQLTSYLPGLADSAPAMGRWVLKRSQQIGLLDGIGQSLAGRGFVRGAPVADPVRHRRLEHGHIGRLGA